MSAETAVISSFTTPAASYLNHRLRNAPNAGQRMPRKRDNSNLICSFAGICLHAKTPLN